MTYEAYRRATDRQPWSDALADSISRYTEKTGHAPTILLLHPQEAVPTALEGLQVRTSRAIDKGCWGLGHE